MSWKTLCAAAVAATALMAPAANAQLAESVAAIVNDEVISTYDVRQRANLLLVSAGMQTTAELQQRARAQALDNLIDEVLQIQATAGDPYNIVISEEEVDRRLDSIARSNNVTREQFVQQLAQAGVSASTLRHQLRADIAWNRLMGGLYGSRIRISDLEIRETQTRIAAGATRPRFLVSEIFLPASNEQEFADMTAGAARLLEQMQRGAPFPAVARQFSAAPTAAAGGDMGWLATTEMPAEIGPSVEQLQPGQMMTVRTREGIHIIALRERREGVAEGATQRVTLRQVSAPAGRRLQLERVQRRLSGCGGLESAIQGIEGAEVIDLGQASESDLSESIRSRISGVESGAGSSVQVDGEQATMVVVCGRETGGGGVPTTEEIEGRLYEQEMAMLSERYLRNLRREATIITR